MIEENVLTSEAFSLTSSFMICSMLIRI